MRRDLVVLSKLICAVLILTGPSLVAQSCDELRSELLRLQVDVKNENQALQNCQNHLGTCTPGETQGFQQALQIAQQEINVDDQKLRFACTPPSPGGTVPQTRMRWQDFIKGPEGAKRLAALEAGIQKMQSLDASPKNSADYRRSWEYWANIHGYYGAQSPDGTVEAQINFVKLDFPTYAAYYQGIQDENPPDTIAQQIWATCQHSEPNQQALNFFGWHRMYLYYFEQVLRWAANDPTLRLPYWDYTDPQQLALPQEFQATSSVLYDSKRKPGINSGSLVLNANSTNVDNWLTQDTDYFVYEQDIEENIHGYVHCTVGPICPVAHMGDVPVAANDPIFYMHHANIDRLWACWQHIYGSPAGSWQNQVFSFVDEAGSLQSRPVSDFLDSTTLGYAYDNVSACTRTAAPPPAPPRITQLVPKASIATIVRSKGVILKKPQTAIDIKAPQSTVQSMLKHVQTEAVRERLILRDVMADSPPGAMFDIYLAKKGDSASRQFVGTISWFGVFRHTRNHGTPRSRTLGFDITNQLRALQGTSISPDLTVAIEATEGVVAREESKMETIQAAAAKAFRPEAHVRFSRIDIVETHLTPGSGK